MKHFVSYEQAIALKELGFNEPCLRGFYIKQNLFTSIDDPVDFNSKKSKGEMVSRPLVIQAFEWFRENHKLKDYICPADIMWSKWGFSVILKASGIALYNEPEYFETYEEAETACLDKLIEIVKANGTKV